MRQNKKSNAQGQTMGENSPQNNSTTTMKNMA